MLVFQNVLWLLVLIGVMIIIHEAGHYWAARYFDVRIETFSFGFGPRLRFEYSISSSAAAPPSIPVT